MTIPSTIDRTLLQTYLSDHLTGATAGRARSRKMAQWYASSPLSPDLTRVAAEIDEEHGRLAALIDDLGLTQPLPKVLLARIGEAVGRLKPNGRLVSGSPMTPLLELELLRSAVNGKQGLWETLVEYSEELGLDPHEFAELARRAGEQSTVLQALHAEIRSQALRPGDGLR